LAFFTLVFIAQMYRDFYFPPGDMARHLVRSLYFHQELKENFSLSTLAYLYFYQFPQFFHPPLVYFTTQPFYVLLGANPLAAKLSIVPFILLLIWSTFLLGRELGNEKTGLLSVFILGACPAVLFYFNFYYLDLPLAALTVLSYYLLLKSRNFSSRGYSMGFGLVSGLGLLTKWNFVFYLLAAFILALINLLKSPGGERKQKIGNLILALLGMLILALPWYLARVEAGIRAYQTFLLPSVGRDLPHDRLEHWVFNLGGMRVLLHCPYYFLYLLKFHFLPPVFLLALLGLVWAFKQDKTRELALTFLLGFLLISLIPGYQDRYLLPLLPFAAVLAVFYFAEANPKLTGVVFVPILTLGLLQTIGWMKPLPVVLSRLSYVEASPRTDFAGQPLYDMGKEVADPWSFRICLPFIPKPGFTQIPELLAKLGSEGSVLMLTDFDQQWMIRTYAELENRPYLYYTPFANGCLAFSDHNPGLEKFIGLNKLTYNAVVCKEGCYFQKGRKVSISPEERFYLKLNPALTYRGTFQLYPGKKVVLLKSSP